MSRRDWLSGGSARSPRVRGKEVCIKQRSEKSAQMAIPSIRGSSKAGLSWPGWVTLSQGKGNTEVEMAAGGRKGGWQRRSHGPAQVLTPQGLQPPEPPALGVGIHLGSQTQSDEGLLFPWQLSLDLP